MSTSGAADIQKKLTDILKRAFIATSEDYDPMVLAELNTLLSNPVNLGQINLNDKVHGVSIMSHIHLIASCPSVDLTIIAKSLVALYDAGFYRHFPMYSLYFLKAAVIVDDQELICNMLTIPEIRQALGQEIVSLSPSLLLSAVEAGDTRVFANLMKEPSILALINDPTSKLCMDLVILAINHSFEDIFDILIVLEVTKNQLKKNDRAFYAAEKRFMSHKSTESGNIYNKVMKLYGSIMEYDPPLPTNHLLLLSEAAHSISTRGEANHTNGNRMRENAPQFIEAKSDKKAKHR